MAMREDIEKSVAKLHHIPARIERYGGVGSFQKSTNPRDDRPKFTSGKPEKLVGRKTVHRCKSFCLENVKMTPAPKFAHIPDCELKQLDFERYTKSAYRIPEPRDEHNTGLGLAPSAFRAAGAENNLQSGYGNNIKMFHVPCDPNK